LDDNTIFLLSFTALPFVLGLAWPGRFRWLAAVGFCQAVVLGWWFGYRDDADWSSKFELAGFVASLYLGVLFPVWLACAALGWWIHRLTRSRWRRRSEAA
jgi:hypothetical protein